MSVSTYLSCWQANILHKLLRVEWFFLFYLKKAFDLIDHHILLKKFKNVSVKQLCHSFFFFNLILAKENKKYLLLDIIHLRAVSNLEFHKGLFLDLFSSVFTVDCDMFADDSSLSAFGNNIAAINAKLQPSIQEVTEWCSAKAMLLNPEKTKSMVVATRQKHQRGLPPLRLLNSQVIEQVSEHRHLGVILDDQRKWQVHINSITNAVAKNVYFLSHPRHFF